MNKFILSIFLIYTLFSCRKNSSEIDQNRIYQEYTVTYNNQTGNTEVSASFREDNASGRKLNLTGGSKVYFNDQPISGKSNFSKTYSGFISPVKIDFVDSEGKKYTNYSFGIDFIEVNPMENFVAGTSNYFSWGGNPVGQNESVTFYARNSDWRSNDQTVSQQGSSSINLNSTFFTNFQNQFFTYWLKRKKTSFTGDFAIVGGQFSLVYRSQDYEEELY